LLGGELRDIRTSPESPAPRPDESPKPAFLLISLYLPFFY